MDKTYILIGSKNQVKINTIQSTFTQLFPRKLFEFRAYNVSSQISSQPWGNDEIIHGAITRAKNAKIRFFEENPHYDPIHFQTYYYVGIEAGLIPIPQTISGYFDIQYCAIFDGQGHLTLGASSGWEYPKEIIQELKRNPKLEIGKMIALRENDPDLKKDKAVNDFYSYIREGRVSRLTECIEMALIPVLNQRLYFPNP
jgi:inosine/xanthosine triphosphatase